MGVTKSDCYPRYFEIKAAVIVIGSLRGRTESGLLGSGDSRALIGQNYVALKRGPGQETTIYAKEARMRQR